MKVYENIKRISLYVLPKIEYKTAIWFKLPIEMSNAIYDNHLEICMFILESPYLIKFI